MNERDVVTDVPRESGFYTARVMVKLDYDDKRGTMTTGFLKKMYWNNTMKKWMVPDLAGKYGKDISEYLEELNNEPNVPYKVLSFECDGYIDDDNKAKRQSAYVGSGNAVSHPSHYNMGGVEVIDAITAWGFGEGFNRGNAIKYIVRAGRKSKETEVQDLRKAIQYLQFEIERLGGGK